jgi:hypothetical protein
MWSKLVGDTPGTETSVQIIAQEKYNMNGCDYHNWQHILDCYAYLEAEQIPYDADLDLAVMHHDIVYDDQPSKEMRSAKFLLTYYAKQRVDAAEIIMATEGHKITADSTWQQIAMIKADLHQLADPVQATRNYVKIMDETIHLYGITPREFAKNNEKFMVSLQVTVAHNYKIDDDALFWTAVGKGIEQTIIISQGLQKQLDSMF